VSALSQVNCLKKWRETKGLTQQELAAAIGVHVQYVSKIERGERIPGMRVATRIRDFSEGALTIDALAQQKAA
jgi:transcriptional regulator with XRE-family HTH domain